MTLAFSTRWLGLRPYGGPQLLEVLRAVDVRACLVARGEGCPPAETLDLALRPAGARVVGVEAPEVEAGFAARSPETRTRAVDEARASAAYGRRVGGRHVILRLGRVEVERAKEREDELFGALRRDGATDDVKSTAATDALVVERRLEPLLDGLCRLLFALCRAEPETRFAIVTPSGPFDLPSQRGLSLLFDEVKEPNLGYWHDVGVAHRLESLGLSPAGGFAGEFAGRTFGVWLHDVVGADLALPPGAGEIDFRAVRDAVPSDIPYVVDVDARVPLDEVKLAFSFLRSVGF